MGGGSWQRQTASCLLRAGGVEALGWTSAGGWPSLESSGAIPEFGVASAAVAFWHVPSTGRGVTRGRGSINERQLQESEKEPHLNPLLGHRQIIWVETLD